MIKFWVVNILTSLNIIIVFKNINHASFKLTNSKFIFNFMFVNMYKLLFIITNIVKI
jgi:hypothetical protein